MEKILPVGTVVNVEGLEAKQIIIGLLLENSNDGKVYDYLGAVYPIGYFPNENISFFDNDSILEVLHEGYHGPDHDEYVELLEIAYKRGKYENLDYEVTISTDLKQIQEKVETGEIEEVEEDFFEL